jgi:hypothetical protein
MVVGAHPVRRLPGVLRAAVWAGAGLALLAAAPADAAPRDDLNVLRTKRGVEDRLPARFSVPSGVTRRSARLARTTPRGLRIFVAGGRSQVCLFAIERSGSSTTCNSQVGMRAGFVAGAIRSPFFGERTSVRGVVPDRVRRVTLTFEGGATRTLTVRRNVWMAETRAVPALVEWVLDGDFRQIRFDDRGRPQNAEG